MKKKNKTQHGSMLHDDGSERKHVVLLHLSGGITARECSTVKQASGLLVQRDVDMT